MNDNGWIQWDTTHTSAITDFLHHNLALHDNTKDVEWYTLGGTRAADMTLTVTYLHGGNWTYRIGDRVYAIHPTWWTTRSGGPTGNCMVSTDISDGKVPRG